MRNRFIMLTARHLTVTSLLLMWALAAGAEMGACDGLIEPFEVVEIGAPAEGIVAMVEVERSSRVEKGQTLVRLETSVERAALEKAEAMAAVEGEIGLQRTQLAFAKRAYERVRAVSAVSSQDKDQAATNIDLTEFRLQKAKERQAQAELEVKKARVQLARRIIQSPISGVVVERYVSPGEYVNNQPLLQVAQLDPLRVEVIAPAQMFGKITPGMTATILPELPQYGEQTASVILVDRVIDPASSTFGVRLELPNAEQEIPSGLKCLVRFKIAPEAQEEAEKWPAAPETSLPCQACK